MACLAVAEGDGVTIYTLLYILISTWTLGEREGEGESARTLGGGKEGGPAASLQVRKLVGAT